MTAVTDLGPRRGPALREAPHNLDAEKSVLGAVFIKPTAFAEVATTLQVDDFFLPAHREVFEAMLALVGRGVAVDLLTVGDELKTRGMLPRLEGGALYLSELHRTTPTAENVGHYAKIVKDKATLRRLIAACAEVQSSAYGDFGEFDRFVQDAEAKIASAVARGAGGAGISTVERALALGVGRAPLATGFRTLDADTRGGLRAGVVVIGGAPGVGKTIWLVQLAMQYALAGIHVAILAADEEPDGLLIRVGQGLGFVREDLESARPAALAAFAQRLREIPSLLLLDGADVTVEAAAHDLRKRAAGAPAALFVDSVQTVAVAGIAEADGARAKVDCVVAALKAAGRSGLSVVASCELARGAYRSKNTADRSEAIAAFKESGAIEYAAHLGLVLSSVKGEVGVVDVEVVKNRWGSGKNPMRLVQNFATATFRETAVPTEEAPGGGLDPEVEADTDVTRAREQLRAHPGVAGLRGLCDFLPGWGRDRRERAARRLRELGHVREERGPRNSVRWFLVDGPAASLPGLFPEPSPGTVARESSRDPAPLKGDGSWGKTQAGDGETPVDEGRREDSGEGLFE